MQSFAVFFINTVRLRFGYHIKELLVSPGKLWVWLRGGCTLYPSVKVLPLVPKRVHQEFSLVFGCFYWVSDFH